MKRKVKRKKNPLSLPDASVSVAGSVGYGLAAGVVAGLAWYVVAVVRSS